MTAAAVWWDVSYRPIDSEADWTVERFAVGAPVVLTKVQRGVDYEGRIAAVSARGVSSAWVPFTVRVASTNRTGAAALPVNSIANQASAWDMDTSVEYSAATDGSGNSQAVIAVSAGDLVAGEAVISYAASSASVIGAPGTQRRVYLYYDDPRLEGGVRTLGVADTFVDSIRGAGRVAIANLALSFPAIGDPPVTGGGSIGGGGGGGGAHTSPEEAVVIE